MAPGLLAGLLFVHGLITTAIGAGAVTKPDAPGVPTTGLSWWPTPLGRSWVVDGWQLGSGASVALGVVWTLGGLALLGASVGLFGVPGLHRVWQLLAVAGGGLSLVAIGLTFHPWYLIALAVNLAIVATQAGARGPLALPGAP
jgi:hypothetical protein